MYELALVCVLVIQILVYLMSYYVTRAIQYRKLHAEFSPIASYKYTLLLYCISVSSIYLFFNGVYFPIVYTVGSIIGIIICLWFKSD
nr:MAG TPA: hypothetical protein [Herelleviridae sp.]